MVCQLLQIRHTNAKISDTETQGKGVEYVEMLCTFCLFFLET